MLFTKNSSSGFVIIKPQTDDTLFLTDKRFAIKEEKQLHQANSLAKEREKFGNETIEFNGGYIQRKSNVIYLTQERQCKIFILLLSNSWT